MSEELSRRTKDALENAARRMHVRRRIQRNATVIGVVVWVAFMFGFPYYFGSSFPGIAEFSFPLGVIPALIAFYLATVIQIKLEEDM